jgi:hypothetical protein
MSTSVTFPDVTFGNVTYGSVAAGRTSLAQAPTAAKLNAKVIGGNGWVTLKMSAETLSWQPTAPGGPSRPVPVARPPGTSPGGTPGALNPPPDEHAGETLVAVETATSDGSTPLPVNAGQSVYVLITISVPSQHLTPGPLLFTLQIESDAWTVSPIAMTTVVIAVDESSPIGIKWLQAGAQAALGTVIANAAPMPDGVGSYQEFQSGTIFYSPNFGASLISRPLYQKLNSPSISGEKTASGQFIRDYLGYPTGDSFATLEQGGQAAYFEGGMLVLRSNQLCWAVYGAIYLRYRSLGDVARGTKSEPVVSLQISD